MENVTTNNRTVKLGLVLPCYNEEAILSDTFQQLKFFIESLIEKKKISADSFIAFVDDGSKDQTWNIIVSLKERHTMMKGLKLSRNCGHQNALLCGLLSFYNDADCIISLDADLQDDIKVIEEMVDRFKDGYEIVYGVRKERTADTFSKRHTALGYYRLMRAMGVDLIHNHADFRLAGKRVIAELAHFQEVNLFLRGIFPLLGYKNTNVYYDRLERKAGETKFPLKKMLSFAFEGITSFSVKPLRWVTITGFVLFLVSLLLMAYALLSYIRGEVVTGWASTTLPMYFLSGIQLLSLGIIGEYLGKIYKEVKQRPRFLVDKRLD